MLGDRGSSHRPPVLIAMAGLPGTGKTTCADLIADHLQLPVIDKDDVLEIVRQSPIHDELEQGRLAYDLVFSLASRQLENGLGVIVDTCLAFGWLRNRLANIAAAHDVPMLIVQCVCDDDTARTRITARLADGLAHRNLAEYERLQRIFEDFEIPPELTVDSTTDLTAVPEQVLEAIGRRQRRTAGAPAAGR